MLPPQLQQPLRQRAWHVSSASLPAVRAAATSMLRGNLVALPSRTCWGWRRQPDYTSSIDPMYHRFTRYRTLKTRAKLLDKIRRRGQWDWDLGQRPFFSPRHVRLASHIGRPKWRSRDDNKSNNSEKQDNAASAADQDDGLELSQREKEWKQQMEAMRRRIEQDPYEAVFGKRFEPFWSPLVPSWMREEMGLPRWPKPSARPASVSEANMPHINASPRSVDSATSESSRKEADIDLEAPNGQLTSYTYPYKKRSTSPATEPEVPNGQLTDYSYAQKKPAAKETLDLERCPNGQLTNYSYSSSTSWDSWTKKARREDWDSISGRTRRYEYDPITNRMVLIEPLNNPKVPVQASPKLERPNEVSVQSGIAPNNENDSTAHNVNFKSTKAEAADDTVRANSTVHKATPITATSNSSKKTSLYFPSLINHSSVVANADKSSAVSETPEKALDSLTADEVRASVGRTKQERVTAADGNVDQLEDLLAILPRQTTSKSAWDQAENELLLDCKLDTLREEKGKALGKHHDRLLPSESQRTALKLDEIVKKVPQQELNDLGVTHVKDALSHPLNSFELMKQRLLNKREEKPKPETALVRTSNSDALHKTTTGVSATSMPSLQPSIERMQSKELPTIIEPDDSAAHESTGECADFNTNNVPENWETQAELLQADRVKRTRGDLETALLKSREKGNGKLRWIDVMNARKAEYDARMAEERTATQVRDARKNAKLAKADDMLQAEVKEQKLRMVGYENRHAHKLSRSSVAEQQSRGEEAAHSTAVAFQQERERYQAKIRDLRKELDIAFKQSSVNAEMQVERIRDLEQKLNIYQKHNQDSFVVEQERFARRKLAALEAQFEEATKEKEVESELRINELKRELEEAYNVKRGAAKGVEATQGEGDFNANITKYAKGHDKWYKKACHSPTATVMQSQREAPKSSSKGGDRSPDWSAGRGYESGTGFLHARSHGQNSFTKEEIGQAWKMRKNGATWNEVQRFLRKKSMNRQVPTVSSRDSEAFEIENDLGLGKALADFEKEQVYQYPRNGFEAQIAAQEKEAHEAQAFMDPETSSKSRQAFKNPLDIDQDVYGTRIVEDRARSIPATEQSSGDDAAQWGIEWEQPPVYKVLAYDSGNDMFSTAVTSSNFTGKETPISIPEALSQLYQPARFVPHFAALQKEGYQVVYGTKDLLVFKKVKSVREKTPSRTKYSTTIQDHGLVKPTTKTASRPTLHRPSHTTRVNPIDGTTHLVEPNTGSFASPTGFVGDNWQTIGTPTTSSSAKRQAPSPSNVSSSEFPSAASAAELTSPHENYSQPADEESELEAAEDAAGTEIRHYPRVKREERVFSGSRLAGRKRASSSSSKKADPTAEHERDPRRKWSGHRSRLRWALGVGLGAGGVAYAVGAAAEHEAKQRRQERWQQILEGKRGRWE